MVELVRGGNAPIHGGRCQLSVEWSYAAGSLDCCAFVLAASGRVRGDADMVFYNQKAGADGAVTLVPGAAGSTLFDLDLDRVPDDVDRVVVCAVVEAPARNMRTFAGLRARLGHGAQAIDYRPDLSASTEAALRLVEVYRRAGSWKLRAIGQGFDAGLAPLARSFGVDVEQGSDGASPDDPPIDRTPDPAAPPPTPLVPKPAILDEPFDTGPEVVVHGRVDDARDATAIQLRDGDSHAWRISSFEVAASLRCRLTWESRQGGADGRPRPAKPSLGAFYVLADGRRGVVQPSDATQAPEASDLVTLDASSQDDGAATLSIRAGAWPEVSRLEVYAYLDGAASWRGTTLRLACSLEFPTSADNGWRGAFKRMASSFAGPTSAVSIFEAGADGTGTLRMATITNEAGDVVVRRTDLHAYDQRALDEAGQWGLSWRTRSDP